MPNIHLPHDHGSNTESFIKAIPPQEIFEKTAETFNLISDPTRVKILWLLCHTEDCVTNISAAISMSLPAVSHHLKILKRSGILKDKKVGKEVYYTLADTNEAKHVHQIVDLIFDLNCKGRY